MRRRRPERSAQYRSPSYRELTSRLAANARRLRERNGWTQEQAAESAQMSVVLYQRIEAEGSNVTFATLGRLCDGFEVDVRKLLAPAKPPPKRKPGRPSGSKSR